MSLFHRRLYHFLQHKAAMRVQQMHPSVVTVLQAETAIASNYTDTQFHHDVSEAEIPTLTDIPDDLALTGATDLSIGGGKAMAWLEDFYKAHKTMCDLVIGIMVQVALKALGL